MLHISKELQINFLISGIDFKITNIFPGNKFVWQGGERQQGAEKEN